MIKIRLALLLHLCRICAGGRNDVAHHQHYSPAMLDPYPEVNGYYLDVSYNHDHNVELQQMEASGPEILECPSNNVITTRYRCQVDDEWTDCTKSRCCPGFTFVAGRCIPDDINPCSLNLCEQKCSVYFGRVICTCFVGYKFNPENHRKAAESNQMQGGGSVCEDIDECQDNHGDCSQVCINTPGSYHCGCRDGFFLHPDNQTCIRPTTHQPAFRDDDEQTLLQQIPDPTGHDRAGQCNANCNTVNKLKRTVDSLTEKVRSLVTAIKLYSFAIGPPGPPGPPGPAGPAGPRGFPGTGALASSIGMADFGEHLALGSPGDDDEEDVMLEEAQDAFDSFKIVKKKGKRHFCKCKRGPIGHTGAPGIQGPRGPKGEAGPQGPKGNAGSFDFLMLMVADLRHDLKQLQDKVFPDKEREPLPPRYNLKQQLTWDQDYPVRPAAVAAASRPSHTTDTESEDSG